jgi:hypothetical protein
MKPLAFTSGHGHGRHTTATPTGTSVTLIHFRPPSYFTHVSITTPIVSALKNYYRWSFLEVQTDFFKVLLDPGGGFTSETAERRFQN